MLRKDVFCTKNLIHNSLFFENYYKSFYTFDFRGVFVSVIIGNTNPKFSIKKEDDIIELSENNCIEIYIGDVKKPRFSKVVGNIQYHFNLISNFRNFTNYFKLPCTNDYEI